ncbi:MAG: alpha/beta fold hydrolase [Thermomicrobiales bacterium]|nr:alpha/beta fold hydrolase [Thermomicrobiales bacterium]
MTDHEETPRPPAVPPPQDALPPLPPLEWQRIPLNGAEIAYAVTGHAPGDAVVLVHGGDAHSEHWAFQVPPLAERYQVILLDSRGHGRSPYNGEPLTYRQLADDVLALLDHLGVPRAHLVGWSDGGITGIDLALHCPERLRKVVAFGANADPSGYRQDSGDEVAIIYAFGERSGPDYARLSPAPERHDAMVAALRQMWETEPAYSADALRTITTPFLIMAGAGEEVIAEAHTRYLAATIPGAHLALLPNCGHFGLMQEPEAFNAAMLAFLAE